MNDRARAVRNSPWGTKHGLIGKLAGQGRASGTGTTFSGPGEHTYEAGQLGQSGGANPFTARRAFALQLLSSASRSLAPGASPTSTSNWLDGLTRMLAMREPDPATPEPAGAASGSSIGSSSRALTGAKGGLIDTSKGWKGTHITDNLDWNQGQKSAADIMAPPGTRVGAPEDGTVVRWGGAQGGQALYFKGSSGALYWMGHIDNRLPVGTTVRRRQPVAVVSRDHAAPHLHIDRKY